MQDRNTVQIWSPEVEDNRLYSDVSKLVVGRSSGEEQFLPIHGTVTSYNVSTHKAVILGDDGATYNADNYSKYPLIIGSKAILAKTSESKYAVLGSVWPEPLIMLKDDSLITGATSAERAVAGLGLPLTYPPILNDKRTLHRLQYTGTGFRDTPDYEDNVGPGSGALLIVEHPSGIPEQKVFIHGNMSVNGKFYPYFVSGGDAFVPGYQCESIYGIESFGNLNLYNAPYYTMLTFSNLLNLEILPATLPKSLPSVKFTNCPKLNDPVVSTWDTSNITNMEGMFYDCSLFDQDLSSWNVENVTDMNNMLVGTAMSTANYDSFLINCASQNVQPDVRLDADAKYSTAAAAARATLTGAPNNWDIDDGGPV